MFRVKYQRLPENLGELVPNELQEIRNDPWGRPYVYRPSRMNGAYEVLSYGADGKPGGGDDVSSLKGGDR